MDKDTQKVLKAIARAKGDIDFALNRLMAEIEGIYHTGVDFAPKSTVEPYKGVLEQDKPPF